jgi:enoyl-CoA hydratase
MPYKTILYEAKKGIGYITLNRPRALNAINSELARELADVCQKVRDDGETRVVILTGAGRRAFSCGGDLTRSGGIGNASRAVAELDRPVICALNGDALDGGLELALTCDIRVASERARFGLTQVARGIIPFWGGTQRLPRLVGRGKALEMILTAEVIGAQEAYRIGLVNMVVPPREVMSKAEELASMIASGAPIAARYAKEAVSEGLDTTLEQGLRLEADLYFLIQTTEDRMEGIRAFLEKRQPKYFGR